MSARLVILGLLHHGPLHGYELKRLIEEEMGDWTAIPFGSIYFALGKLREEGSVVAREQEREGKRPEKTVYAITEKGKEVFLSLLRETLGSQEAQKFEIDQALAFSEALPREEVSAFFKARVGGLAEAIAQLARHEAEQMSAETIPPIARAIFLHGKLHLQAELDWSRTVLESIERGIW
jgi:DNA-binding PadR family transcriptional regulator